MVRPKPTSILHQAEAIKKIPGFNVEYDGDNTFVRVKKSHNKQNLKPNSKNVVKHPHMAINAATVRQFLKKVFEKNGISLRISKGAMLAIQYAAQHFLSEILKDGQLIAGLTLGAHHLDKVLLMRYGHLDHLKNVDPEYQPKVDTVLALYRQGGRLPVIVEDNFFQNIDEKTKSRFRELIDLEHKETEAMTQKVPMIEESDTEADTDNDQLHELSDTETQTQ